MKVIASGQPLQLDRGRTMRTRTTMITCAAILLLQGCGSIYGLATAKHGSHPAVGSSTDTTYDFAGLGLGFEVNTRFGETEVEGAVGVKRLIWNGVSRDFGTDFSITQKFGGVVARRPK